MKSGIYLVGVRPDGVVVIWERDRIKYSVIMKKSSGNSFFHQICVLNQNASIGLNSISNVSVAASETFFVVTFEGILSLFKSI